MNNTRRQKLGDVDRLNQVSWGVAMGNISPIRFRVVGTDKWDGEVRLTGLGKQSGHQTEFKKTPLARVGPMSSGMVTTTETTVGLSLVAMSVISWR